MQRFSNSLWLRSSTIQRTCTRKRRTYLSTLKSDNILHYSYSTPYISRLPICTRQLSMTIHSRSEKDINKTMEEFEVEFRSREEGKPGNTEKFNVSRKGLFKRKEPTGPASSPEQWKLKTELEKHLITTIQLRGPLSVSTYMREVLTNPAFGYYSTQTPFGSEGDFITSPEISQMFGELVGVWIESTWEQLGRPSPFKLIELGPGRGTMMSNIMRVLSQVGCIEAMKPEIHFVENSFQLQEQQASALSCRDSKELKQWQKKHKNIITSQYTPTTQDINDVSELQGSSPVLSTQYGSFESRVKVQWHLGEELVPPGPFALVAHEFFDALPVTQFVYRDGEWKERLIDINTEDDRTEDFRFVVAPRSTPASDALNARPLSHQQPGRNMGNDTHITHNPEEGAELEICSAGEEMVRSIAERVRKYGGSALVMDYGQDGASANSIRAIKDHAFTHIFESPGTCDLSADVDFHALKRVAEQETSGEDQVNVLGPIDQGEFFENLGIDARLAVLLKNPSTPFQDSTLLGGERDKGGKYEKKQQEVPDSKGNGEVDEKYSCIKDEKVRAAVMGYERIIDRDNNNMGSTYKVMAIQDPIIDFPVGFM